MAKKVVLKSESKKKKLNLIYFILFEYISIGGISKPQKVTL